MADAAFQQGLLDASKLKPSDLREVTSALGRPPTPAKGEAAPALFERPPEFDDVDALLEARPPDYSLYNGLSSLLNGLSSGPAQVMGLFRAISPSDVVVRLYVPQRPQPGKAAEPLYFVLSRGHARLAIEKKWVGASAPTWLALLAAAYNAYIGSREAFYARKDLGGADNAAWLVLFGRDSSRAKYEDKEKDRNRRGGAVRGSRGAGGSSRGARESEADTKLLARVLGVGDDELDKQECRTHVFDDLPEDAKRLTKEWLSWVDKSPPNAGTGLRAGLQPKSAGTLSGFRKWLDGRAGLSAKAKDRLLWFLEANGALQVDEKERYRKGALAIFDGIRESLHQRNRVALELTESDPAIPMVAEKGLRTAEIIGWNSLALPDSPEPRSLFYVSLPARKGGGLRYRWHDEDELLSLRPEPSKKLELWLELDDLLRRATRIFVGGDAVSALAKQSQLPSFTVPLKSGADLKTLWPK